MKDIKLSIAGMWLYPRSPWHSPVAGRTSKHANCLPDLKLKRLSVVQRLKV